MYEHIETIGVRSGLDKRWGVLTSESLALSLSTLFATYRKLQTKLQIAGTTNPLYFDLDSLRPTHSFSELTIAQFLVANGNIALSTASTGIVLNHQTARYGDIVRLGYKLTPVNSANSDSPLIALEDKDHVRLTRTAPQTDYANMYAKSLVSVNGLYHLTDTDGVNGVMVMDAMRSSRIARDSSQMGVLSFQNVGSLEQVRITPSMVVQDSPRQALITLEQDLTNKTVFLVLGGYLHPVDPTVYQRVSVNSFRILFNSLPLLERYYESKRFIDLSSLPVQHSSVNEELVNVEDFYSDENLLAYLQLSQTFFVIINAPEIYTQRQYLRSTGTPDLYITYQKPIYPFVTSLGRQPEYWSVYEDQQWAIHTYKTVIEQRLFNTTRDVWNSNVDNSRVPHYSGLIPQGYFLEIGRDI